MHEVGQQPVSRLLMVDYVVNWTERWPAGLSRSAATIGHDHNGHCAYLAGWLWRLDQTPEGAHQRPMILDLLCSELAFLHQYHEKNAGVGTLTAARAYIQDNFHRALSLAEVARTVGWSAAHLSRRFKAHFGMGPNRYLQEYRCRKAIDLLTTTNASVKDVALAVGLQSPAHLGRLLKRYHGTTPSSLRN